MIVLDTNALVWLISNTEKIPQKTRKLIDAEKVKSGIFVSSISVWEIFLSVKKGKLVLSMDVDTWLDKIEKLSFLNFIPVDNQIAAKSVMLPGQLHSDPADRIIIATAREYGAKLVTSDQKILGYRHVQSVW